VPTFVDKPFAYEAKDAVKLAAMAKKHRVPVMSLSILRSVPQLTWFSRRFNEVGGVDFGTVKGGGTTMAGHVHAISIAQHVFGNGVESVECMGQTELAYVHLNYGDRKDRPKAGVVLNCFAGGTPHCAFYVSAYGPTGAIHTPPVGDYEFPWGAARNLEIAREMVKTGKPPVSYDDMIENIAVATAARKAQKTGRTVKLSEVGK
jgi:predicted dehydrogenase